MSTATQNPSESTRYVDYDEFIDFQVEKTRAGIKSNDLLTALIGASVGVLAYVLVFAVFDHWVIAGGFGRGTRILLLSLLVSGLCGWFVWKVVRPYFRRVTRLYAAREIEETEPAFRSSLLTLVDLKQAGRTLSPAIRASLERRAGLGLTHMNVEQAVDRRLLMRLSYVLLGLVVATCLYSVLSPKKLSNSLWRSLLPTASVSVDTRTRIERVKPGNADVLARAQLEVTAELSGVIPDEVTLLYSTADRRLVDEPISMRQTDNGLREFRGVIAGENGRGILQNLTYHITAGDAHSETYTVTVSQPPSATVDEVEYEYPRYMGLQNRVQVGGAVEAWEGAWATIRATANTPVASALVKFSDTDDITQKAEELPVTIENGTLLSARWQLRIRPDGTFPNFYRIECRNAAGMTDPLPALYPVKVLPDLAPQIQLAQPTSDLDRPANAVVPLLYAAQDPDFLLRSIILRFERNGETLPQAPRLYEGPPDRKSITSTYDFDLGPLALQPGDKLTYWLEARDNLEPFADRSGNRANTPRLNITISEPASADDVQQQLADDRRQVQERLDEAQQPSDPAAAQASPPDREQSPEDPPPNDTPPTAEDPARESPASPDEASEPGEHQPGDQQQEAGQSSDSQGRAQSQPSGANGTDEERTESTDEDGPRDQNSQRNQDAPFDDLLQRLMQREHQQPQPGKQATDSSDEGNSSSQTQEPSDSDNHAPSTASKDNGSPKSPPGDRPQEDPSQAQPTSTNDPSPAGADPQRKEGTGPSAAPKTNDTSPTPADVTQPQTSGGKEPGDPQPGEGTEPASDSKNPAVREGNADGGKSAPAEDGTDTGDAKPTSESPAAGNGPRKPSDGSASGDPQEVRKDQSPNAENQRPAPNGANSEAASQEEPSAAKPGEPQPQSQPKPGQSPADADNQSSPSGEKPSGASQPKNASGEKPPGAESQSDPTGGDSPSPPSPSGQSGQQGQAGQSGEPGKPSSGQSNQGNPKPGSAQPGSGQAGADSKDQGDQPPSAAEQKPQGDDSATKETSPAGSGPNNSASDPKANPNEQPAGEGTSSDGPPDGQRGPEDHSGSDKPQESGGQKGSGGQQDSGEQSGGKQESGEGGQQPGGQQPGGNESGGKPGGGEKSGGQSGGGGEGGSKQGGQAGGGTKPGGQAQDGSAGGGATQDGTPDSQGSGGGSGASNSKRADPQRAGSGAGAAEEGAGAGEGTADADVRGDDPDLENKKKSAELVLKRLQEQLQRGEIDPQLRKELGATDEQMRDFIERLQQRLADTGEDQSPEAQARRRQFEETLRTIEYESSGTKRAGGDGPREATGSFAGPQRTAPLNRRDATRAYRERLAREHRPAN